MTISRHAKAEKKEIERAQTIWTGFSHLVRYSIYTAAALLFALLVIFIM